MGALLANLLGARGVPVVVYERAPAPHAQPRAAHLDDEAMRVLQAAGVADRVASGAREIDGMDVRDAGGRLLIHARKRPAGAGWPAANLVHQPDIEAALRAGLSRYPNVEVRAGHEVRRLAADDAGATMDVSGPTGDYVERASWAVGCDGAHSVVRDAIGARMRAPGVPFEERWLVVDVVLREDVDLPARLTHMADPRRPTTYVPFAGRRRRWEFRLRAGEVADVMATRESVSALLRPHVDQACVEIDRAAVYRFAGAVASRWRKGRLLLAGDAAHVMPPFIGQGLCAGMRDCAFLGWALAAVARGAPGALLDAYERERRPHVVAATRLSVLVGRFVGMPRAGAAARDSIVRLLRHAPPLSGWLDGLEVRAPAIAPAVAGAGGRALRTIPQPWVEANGGERLRLDDALGPGWSVVGIGLDPREWAGDNPAWTAADTRFVRIRAPGESADAPALRDAEAVIARWARRAPPFALVVRPDRSVFGVYPAGAGRRAAAQLAAWVQ